MGFSMNIESTNALKLCKTIPAIAFQRILLTNDSSDFQTLQTIL